VGGGAPATLTATTDPNGVAQVFWVPANDPARPSQSCVATLTAAPSGLPLGSPVAVRFSGRLSLASQVSYTPASSCVALAGVTNVQAALDQLCAGAGQPPQRIVVQNVKVGNTPLRNDQIVAGATLGTQGIDIVCDQSIDQYANKRWVASVTVEPWENQFPFFTGWQPLTLFGIVTVVGNTIQWRAYDVAKTYLQGIDQQLFLPLAKLMLRGNFVWGSQNPERYLDGELFEGRVNANTTQTQFPSGDGVRGGDLELFFWVGVPWIFSLGNVEASGTTTARVTIDSPAPEGGLTLRLTSSDPAAASVPETVTIPAGETSAEFQAKVKAPKSGTQDVTIASGVVGMPATAFGPAEIMHNVRLGKAPKPRRGGGT